MTPLTLTEAMADACARVGVRAPDYTPRPGRFVRADTLERNGKADASILIFDDARGGMVWNHQTALNETFRVNVDPSAPPPVWRPDPKREARRRAEGQAVLNACQAVYRACRQEPHPYLAAKGFPDELAYVIDDPREHFPAGRLGEAIAKALPEAPGPFLVVPGRIGKLIVTLQFITPNGEKKNLLRGRMGGASHRIATGRETWVCEGFATALTVRAALRLLGVSATVLSAFAANNVERVAQAIPGARIAADHDKPVEALGGLGTGEFYARRSGAQWIMPPAPGDFNDMHQAEGLRAVALRLREAV